jgi:hypothetical protein
VRDLKATVDGEIDVAGPELAAAVAPLIDEYRLYFRPYCSAAARTCRAVRL